jgi:hypothetical protein
MSSASFPAGSGPWERSNATGSTAMMKRYMRSVELIASLGDGTERADGVKRFVKRFHDP